jgi:hypothetical protein
MATMPIKTIITIEEEAETPSPEAEAVDLQASTIKASIQALLHHSLNNSKTSNLSLHPQGNQKDLLAKSIGSKVTMPLIVITEWILLIKAKIQHQTSYHGQCL